MPQLTRKEVDEIAMLARLHLEPDEAMRMQDELGKILDHFLALATVDTDGVPAMTHAVPMDLRLRADEVTPSLPTSEAVRAAPAREGDLFVVPAIIGGGEK
ncbi:MAG TPA: Asp-tRNA(Asn)/Glu-tRNA(Gln) amidotransferase subunit GatC [Kofleriaceae bacterium]|nr:Asp-tRNA(Asn)/Glu-tRNA(Gln) amidotransferase subunit GatC [Kofleriaceae bacterium]